MAEKNGTRLRAFVDACGAGPVHIGMDVHKASYHVALLRHDGGTHTFVAPAAPRAFVQMLKQMKLNVAKVVYEAGPTGFALARTLHDAGLSVAVLAPSRMPRPVARGAKTDRLDCLKLAELAAGGKLAAIAIPTPEEETARCLVRRRHDLVRSVRVVKQRIRSLLLYLGVEEPNSLDGWSLRAIRALGDLPLEGQAGQVLRSLLDELGFLCRELKLVHGRIAAIMQSPEHAQAVGWMRSIPGVGPVVSASFRLEVFRPERFGRAEELTSYLGLAPMVRQSGQGKGRARLAPVGQKVLRSLLVEAAWRWKAKDPQAEARYRRLLARTGLPQKAIVALARNLAGMLWRVCVEKRPYELRQVA